MARLSARCSLFELSESCQWKASEIEFSSEIFFVESPESPLKSSIFWKSVINKKGSRERPEVIILLPVTKSTSHSQLLKLESNEVCLRGSRQHDCNCSDRRNR